VEDVRKAFHNSVC